MSSFIKAEFHSTNTFKMPSHYHDYHQLIFVTKGNASFNTNKGILYSQAGSLNILNHLTEHSIIESSEDYERYVLKINPAYHTLTDVYGKIYVLLFSLSLTVRYTLDISGQACEFEELFKHMTEESRSCGKFSDEMLTLLFSELLIKLYRLFPEVFETIDEKNFDIVGEIQREFEAAPENRYTLAGLSQKYAVSASTLSHSFKKITGTSVMNYLNYCRIDKAKQYLSNTDMLLSEIVEKCGFTDFSNFSRNFKNANGISPSEYRRKTRI